MISASPSSLNYKNSKAQLPIESAMYRVDSVRYARLLAKEGVKHKVSGKDGRGGLLLVDNGSTDNWNTLHFLTLLQYDENPKHDMYTLIS